LAAESAYEVIRSAVKEQRIRLYGRLDPSLPADIDPTEIEWNGVHLFDHTVEVYDRGKTLRTYRNVHCYEAEVEGLLTPGAPVETDIAVPSGIQTNRQAALKAECVAWIKAVPKYPAPVKEDLEQVAKQAIRGLSGRQFTAAWNEAAPAAWTLPGPKRK
jgi:hypothetical protein